MSEYILKVPEHKSPYDPAVQAASLGEEIVRCKDCRYMFDWAYDRPLCKLWADGVLYPTIKPDGFCAWGDRK